MQLKWIFCLIFPFFYQTILAQTTEPASTIDVMLSLTKEIGAIKQDNPMFIDTSVNTIYFSLATPDVKLNNGKIYVELKKKSKVAETLKPLWFAYCKLDFGLSNIDSIDVKHTMTESGNYVLKFYWVIDSQKVFGTSWGLQVLRSKNEPIQTKTMEMQYEKNQVDISKTFVQKYSLEQIRKNVASLLPIASDGELHFVQKDGNEIEMVYLKQFFYNFWFNRDSRNPEKAWKEYADKLNDVAKKYGTHTMAGYQTDRGRIFLKYGTPDKIEKVMNEKDALPYEIWFYYNTIGRGNVKFLFAQPGNMGNEMFLIHSNQEDEIINPYWPQQLITNSTGVDDKLKHRAYEYFN